MTKKKSGTQKKITQTCDYKFLATGGAIPRIIRFYERLTGKQIPPIDSWYFNSFETFTGIFNEPKLEIWVNGQLSNLNYHFNDKIVAIPIVISAYDDDPTAIDFVHAISAVKYKNTLFCFNSHGIDGLYIDEKIFNQLAKKYKCKNVLIYNGQGLQNGDPHGVCAGYAMNFILEILLLASEDRIPTNLSQKQYDDFVFRAMTKRGILFGGTSFKTKENAWNKMENNLSKLIVTPSKNFKLNRTKVENLSFKRKGIINKITGAGGVNYVIQTPTSPYVQSPNYGPVSPNYVPVSPSFVKSLKYNSPVYVPNPNSGNRNKVVAAKTLKDLKNVARKRKIKGFSTYKKSEMENLRKIILTNMNLRN